VVGFVVVVFEVVVLQLEIDNDCRCKLVGKCNSNYHRMVHHSRCFDMDSADMDLVVVWSALVVV
jgi:hypothetical protein